MNASVFFEDLGSGAYPQVWDYQEKLFNNVIAQKLYNRDNPLTSKPTVGHLLFVEHPHVFTLGKSGEMNNLLINDDFLASVDATFFKTNRGGDITYHGPGQIVGYPIFDLELMGLGLKNYIEKLEDVIILTIAEYGLKGVRLDGATGVWLDTDVPGRTRKICAIGVRASRYVSMHGFALNVNTDLKYFSYINPCGFIDKSVTSLQLELGRIIDLNEVKEKLKHHFQMVFQLSWQ